jgi:hypothetical protein
MKFIDHMACQTENRSGVDVKYLPEEIRDFIE